jgi:hypothetical protein
MRCALGLIPFAACAVLVACDGDDTVAPNQPRDSGTADVTVEGGSGGDGSTTTNTTLCAKYGGFANVTGLSTAIFDAVKADCRISAYFTGLALTDQKHLQDCMANQIGEALQCDGKLYEGSKDTLGGDCRSMAEAHQIDPGIRSDDFNAFMADVATVLTAKGLGQDGAAQISSAFLATHNEIVQTDQQGNAQSICPGADAGQDAGKDTGADAAKDTGIADANDAG